MSKLKYILPFILILSVLASCGVGDGGSFLDYQSSIGEASVSWDIGGRAYSADIVFDGGIPDDPAEVRCATVTVTSPETISGTVVTYSPEGVTAAVGGVSFPLPENMGREIYRILRSLGLYDDEIKGAGNGSGEVTAVRFEVPLYGGITEYDITYGEEYPDKAVIKWDGGEMTVHFDYRVGEPRRTDIGTASLNG
ncbi:MAG: hypothetical protein IJ386_10155 [Clostridia bacterium]|nr:hypothetical protein [Clostridia bacterium]